MTTIDPKAQRLLDLPLPDNDADAATVRDYLIALLRKLWAGGEDFIKRPFGNSGWQYEVYAPMVAAGLIDGKLDEDGWLEHADDRAADALMDAAIQALGLAEHAEPRTAAGHPTHTPGDTQ